MRALEDPCTPPCQSFVLSMWVLYKPSYALVFCWFVGAVHGKARELLVAELACRVVATRVRAGLLRQVRFCRWMPGAWFLCFYLLLLSSFSRLSEHGRRVSGRGKDCNARPGKEIFVQKAANKKNTDTHTHTHERQRAELCCYARRRLVSDSEVKAFDDMMQEAAKKHLGLDVSLSFDTERNPTRGVVSKVPYFIECTKYEICLRIEARKTTLKQ